MTRFRQGVGFASLAAVLLTLAGCSSWAAGQRSTVRYNYPHSRGETLTQSPHEHNHYVSQVSAMDARALVDDLDLLFMTDRPSRLNRWHDR
ncbi:MAG: hypothetical protein PVI86_13770 [Phycisphaerae bacterium]|jgi:hypothetical protein